MPNWCHNRLTVLGPAKLVEAFAAMAKGPYHETLPAQWEKDHPDKEPDVNVFSFHQLVPLPPSCATREYDGEADREADNTGHDWERRVWGIKWGASESEMVELGAGQSVAFVTYKFTTPWGPGHKFFDTLATYWPKLRIALSYEEEYPSRGRLLWKDGERVAKACKEDYGPDGSADAPPDYPENGDEGEPEYDRIHPLHEAWQTLYYDSHQKWVEFLLKERI